MHQQYSTWLYLAAAFSISVLIVQLIVWLKDLYFDRRAQKLEKKRAELAMKLEAEKSRQKRRQALERDIRYFNHLTLSERKILLEAFQKKRGTFEANMRDQSVNRLVTGGYLTLLAGQDPYEIFIKTMVLSHSTIDLLDECFDELLRQYEQDKNNSSSLS